MSRLKVGVIGAGGIAHAHLPRLMERSDAVEVIGVADVNAAAALATAEKYGLARQVADYRELLPAIDAVLICVPTHLHAAMAVDALEAGKHVFCEKPLARTLEQADAIAAAAARSPGALQVGFVRRFDHEWLAWREAVQAGKIGRPVTWRHIAATSVAAWSPWFCRDEMGGGPFLDGCIHNYDFALHTFGPVSSVYAQLRTMNPTFTALDTGTVAMRFESGDELIMSWSWGLPHGSGGNGAFDFLGPQGSITWPSDGVVRDGERRFVINTGDATEEVWFDSAALRHGYELQMDEFIAVARGEAKPRAGLAESYESLRVALAVLEAGRSGEIVRLPPGTGL